MARSKKEVAAIMGAIRFLEEEKEKVKKINQWTQLGRITIMLDRYCMQMKTKHLPFCLGR